VICTSVVVLQELYFPHSYCSAERRTVGEKEEVHPTATQLSLLTQNKTRSATATAKAALLTQDRDNRNSKDT